MFNKIWKYDEKICMHLNISMLENDTISPCTNIKRKYNNLI